MSLGKILLVDDEPHIPMVVGRKLSSAGYEVSTASDGEEGLEAVKELMPDLVITDLQMPYMSGVELAAAIHADEELRHVPVVLLTARGYVLGDEERAKTDIRKYLAKPFSVQEILSVVSELLGTDQESEAA